MKQFRNVLLGLAATFLISTGIAQAAYLKLPDSSSGQAIEVQDAVKDDAYLAGSSLSIKAPVAGELFAAGSTVNITKKPGRSIFAAGSTVTITDGSGYNVYAAGSSVTLDGTFERDVFVGGTDVVINPGTVIKGDLHVGGTTLDLEGKVLGSVYVGAEKVTSKADISGDMSGTITQLQFTGGSIGKNLEYVSNNTYLGMDKVKIAGKTKRTDLNDATTSPQKKSTWDLFMLSVVSFLFLGGIISYFAPRKTEEIQRILATEWGRSFWHGLIGSIVPGILFLILSVTLLGWRVAVVGGGLYLAATFTAGVFGLMFIGNKILANIVHFRTPSLYADLFIGTVLVAILNMIPNMSYLVILIVFLGATMPALGAIMIWAKENIN